MILRLFLKVVLIALPISLSFGQVVDDFTDGDFTANPAWAGNMAEFTVLSGELMLNAPAASSESYLATPNFLMDSTTWEFSVRMDFNPTSSNQALIYLASNSADLSTDLNGYFVLIGSSDHEISLFRQEGNSTTKIIDGVDGSVDSNPVNVNIRVTRDLLGNWSLFRNLNDGSGEVVEGSATDNTFNTTSYFGFLADYTSTRSDLFFFDNITVSAPLSIDSIFATSSNELLLRFNQPVSLTNVSVLGNYSIDNGISIASANISPTNSSEVIIVTNELLVENTYELTIENLADANTDTPITGSRSASFDYLPLLIEGIATVSDSEIMINFNQSIDQVSAETVGNYTINNGIGTPSSANINPMNTSQVTLGLTNPLVESINYAITVSSVGNLIGNSAFNGTSSDFQFIIPLLIDSLLATSQNNISIVFNDPLDEASARTLVNYDVQYPDNNIVNPQEIMLINDSTVRLVMADDFTDGTFTITANNVENLNNTLSADGLLDSFDYLNLVINTVNVLSNSEIQVIFNQSIDSVSARSISNYNIDFGIGNPISTNYRNDTPDRVVLSFNNLANNSYEITFANILNRNLNSSVNGLTDNFQIITATDPRDIVLTEIFADPSPSIGLPGSEFIELLNRSNNHINLMGFEISGGTLPDFTIAPGGYVILTATGNVDDYTSFGDVLGVPSFPSLTNSGRSLVLTDNLSNQLDSLAYDLTWYRNEESANGGITLELINPDIPCNGAFNWIASISGTGGSPGTQNSVFDDTPDTSAPVVTMVEVIEPDSIVLLFNEPIDQDASPIGSFIIAGNPVLSSILINSGFGGIGLRLSSPLTSESFITITYEGITDCTGNISASADFMFYYDITPPRPTNIIVNSFDELTLFFNEPVVESTAESEDNFMADNSLGQPSSAILNNDESNSVRLRFANDFVLGTTYVLNVSNVSDTLGNVIISENINFEYIQSVDSVAVIAPNLLDIYFNISLDGASAQTITNYELESIGNPTQAILDSQNGNLVHLVFQEAIAENSERSLFIDNLLNASLTLTPTPEFLFTYDTRSPIPLEVEAVNGNQALVTFNDQLLENSAELVNNYELNDNIFPDSIQLQLNQTQAILFFRESFEPEVIQELTISEVADVFGNSSSTRRSFEFIYDPLPPRFDTLIQIATDTLLFQFSEAIESSSGLQLSNYVLSVANIPTNAFFMPGDSSKIFLVLNSELPDSESIIATLSNLSDRNGNVITAPIEIDFNTRLPRVSTLTYLDPNRLNVTFSKPMNILELGNVNNYSTPLVNELNSVTVINNKEITLSLLVNRNDSDTTDFIFSNSLTDLTGNQLIETRISTIFLDQIDNISLVNNRTIALTYDLNLSNPNIDNFRISEEMSSPVAASLDPEEPNIVRLFFNEEIPINTTLTISWQEILDEFGNIIPDGQLPFTIDTTLPEIESFNTILFNQLQLVFTEPVNEEPALAFNHFVLDGPVPNTINEIDLINDSTLLITYQDNLVSGNEYTLSVTRIEDLSGNMIADSTLQFTYIAPQIPQNGELIITEIMADPTPVVGLPDAEYIEIYNTSDQPFDLALVSLNDLSGTAQLPAEMIQPQEYVLLTSETNASLFSSRAIGVPSFLSLGNTVENLSLVGFDNNIIDRVVYTSASYNDDDRNDGGYSLERISLLQVCDTASNWTASNATTGGTPGIANSVLDNSPDVTAPEINEANLVGTTLTISFNEPMDPASFQSEDFVFTPLVNITDISPSIDGLSIILTGDFSMEIFYDLTMSNISDCSGNDIVSQTITVGNGRTATAGDILFTEVMADPTPVVGLPDAEYIELFNASTEPLQLGRLIFGDASNARVIPSFLLPPQSYAILTGTSNAALFTGNVIGIDAFPSLGNSEDSLFIVNLLGETIDQFEYTSEFYNDQERDNGGFSLERISLLPVCNVMANWTASDDPSGGTPGLQNSVFDNSPDTDNPEVSGFSFTGDSLIITFSEPMDTTSFQSGVFETNPAITFSSISASSDRMNIILTADFVSGVFYQTAISNISDCSGNVLAVNSTTFGTSTIPQVGELVITEIMADPTPIVGLPDAEYIEIYNSADVPFDLSLISISDQSNTNSLPSFILDPQEYLILTANANTELFNASTLGITGFPSLGNSGDSLSLINSLGQTIDFIAYTTASYNDEERDNGGFSLERISLLPVCNVMANWTASDDPSGGTPGLQNSVFDNTPDTNAPLVNNLIASNDTLIITFNEPMDTLTFLLENFNFTPSVNASAIFPSSDRSSAFIIGDFLQGILYQLTVSEVSDCSSNLFTASPIEFGVGTTPSFGDLIFTEIMADPEPSQGLPITEYLEIFNTSNDILNLSGITLADATGSTTLPNGIILPGEYLVLTPSSSVDLFTNNEQVLGVNNWVSLSNSGERLSLSVNNTEIFSVNYEDDWYDDPFFEGGRSLEMIDVSNICGEDNNWTVATEALSGTPGGVNSVTTANPDLNGPELINAFAIDPNTIELIFNERVLVDESRITINLSPLLSVTDISLIDEGNRILRITTGGLIAPQTNYTVSVDDLTDCVGNTSSNNELSFVLAETPEEGDILLNEILFNPRTNGNDFVELINKSNKFINLKDWSFANDAFFETRNKRLISAQNLIIGPSEHIAFTADRNVVLAEYPSDNTSQVKEVSSLPTLPNDEGTILLITPFDEVADQFDYQDDFHFDLLDSDDGVSLERIDVNAPTNDPVNWKSAASTVGFATPGEINSQIQTGIVSQMQVEISPKVFVPGVSGNTNTPSFTTINYQGNVSGNFANVTIYDSNGQFIKTIANGELLSANGFFRWDGLKENGGLTNVGYYIVIFELFDNNGNTETIKETVVVGTQL